LTSQVTAESICRKIGAFDHLGDFIGHSFTATEFEELPALQKTLALQRMALFTRYECFDSCAWMLNCIANQWSLVERTLYLLLLFINRER